MGMSMGGLVARYALRHMEQTNQTHDTKLYISHDTPHQGANVPLGVQALVRHLYGEEITLSLFANLFTFNIIDFSDAVPGLKEGFDLLNEPAAQQMLIYQLQGEGTNITVNNNSLSTAFYNEYHTMGKPTQGGIKTIAISNGAECGTSLDFLNNASLVNIDKKIDLPWFATNIVLGVLNAWNLNPVKFVSSILSTDTDIDAVFRLKALPNQQVKEVYHGDVFISKTILWTITVHESIIYGKTINSQANMLPLDNASGGIYDIEQFAGNLPPSFNSYILEKQFSFIPTYSSLNIGSGNQTITAADLNATYSPLSPPSAPKNVPFNNFFTNPATSINHIQFTLNNGNWLLEELKGNNASVNNCLFTCGSPTIMGEDVVCDNSNYTINTNFNVNWSITEGSNLVSLSTVNHNTINLSLNNTNNTGFVTLQGSVNPSCGSFIITKRIYFGTPQNQNISIFKAGSTTLYNSTWNWINAIYNSSYSYNIPNWEWRFYASQGVTIMSRPAPKSTIHVRPTADGTVDIQARVSNKCGYSGWRSKTFQIGNGGGSTGGGPGLEW